MAVKFDEKSCGIVLFRLEEGQRKYLILHYPSGHWDLVKGHVEEGDKDEHETARREMEEETGIQDVNFFDGYREEISYRHRLNGKMSNKQVVFFLGETQELDVKISHEHQNFRWLSYDEAIPQITFDNAKNLLHKAEEYFSTF